MIERQTLARRIARHTGQPEADVQYMFDNPTENPTGPCWIWQGATGGTGLFTPMMKYQGRARPVRGVLVGPYSTVNCGHPFCVNPSHSTPAQSRLLDDEPKPTAEPEPTAEIDELLEMLNEGFTEAQLLTMYEPGAVQEAQRLHATGP